MNRIIKFLFIVFIFLICSCDILRFSLFEVTKWTPGLGYHNEPGNISITLDFSRDPDTASVEKNFSLTGNGKRIRGGFSWNGRSLTFTPLTGFEINTDYILNISQDAHDVKGLSMDEAFNCSFTTRPDNTRPVLLSYFPELFAEIDDQKMKVRLGFSVYVPVNSLYDNISFSPSISGIWQYEGDENTAVFTPFESWSINTKYEIRISTSLSDIYGNNPGKEFVSFFTIGEDREAPYLLSAHRINKNGEQFELQSDKGYAGITEFPVENTGWEKEDILYLVFSEPVDRLSFKNYLSADNAPNLLMDTSLMEITNNYNSEFYFKFEDIPAYESRFTIRIKPGIKDKYANESKDEYIYRIFANGEYSKPPVLIGLRMPLEELYSIGAEDIYQNIDINEICYPSEESIPTWIELYFDTASNAIIDIFSIMEFFHIETSNNVITFSPNTVKSADFTVTEPHEGWENYQRIEITGSLINSVKFGVIYFVISPGLKDSFNNINENTQRIPVVK